MVQSVSEPKPSESQVHEALDALLKRVGQGDADAWRELVARYTDRIFGLMFRQCRDRDLAEELTQATFVKIVTRLDGYEELGKFEPWLFRVAMNLLRDEMRRRKRQATPMAMTPGAQRSDGPSQWAAAEKRLSEQNESSDNPLEQMEKAEQIEIMQLAVTQLSEDDQRILHLRHAAGLTFAQIAEMEETPLGTVLARGHRALAKLRKLLVQEDES